MLFSTWIHELFHGLAALSLGGKILWLNIYPDGSGLAYTSSPAGVFQQSWVASSGYQSTAIVGGIMLMFRRTARGARVCTSGIGLVMLLTCMLFVRNTFGLAVLVLMGAMLTVAGWNLSAFWVSELYTLVAATTCLNAITSVQVLFFVTESSIGGVARSSDAMTMQDLTMIPYQIWALMWIVLALWMTAMGVFLVLETHEKACSSHGFSAVIEESNEDHPLTTELT